MTNLKQHMNQLKSKSKFKLNRGVISPKLVFFVMLVVIVLTAVALLTKGSFQGLSATTAKLYTDSSVPAVTVGQSVSVRVFVDTSGQDVRGVDAVVTFDKTKLQLAGVSPDASIGTTPAFKTFLPVNPSGAFDEASVIVAANNTGKIAFSAVSFDKSQATNGKQGLLSPFKGTAQLATLKFVAKSAGSAALGFDFSPTPPGSTMESNVVLDGGTDVLGLATGVTLTVNPISPAPAPSPSPSPTPVPPPPSSCIPRPACLNSRPPCLLPEPEQGWCPPGGVSPSPSPAPTPTPNPSKTAKVAKIAFETPQVGKAQDSVQVVDGIGEAVRGATVKRQLTNTTTNQMWALSAVTVGDGWAWNDPITAPSGCYTVKILSITATGYTWDGVTPSNKVCK